MKTNRVKKFDKRVDELIDDAEVSLSNRELQEGELQSFSYTSDILDNKEEIYELSLGELREFSRVLTNATINSPENPQTLDHFQYWAWTAAFASTSPPPLPMEFDSSIGDFLDIVSLKISAYRRAKITHLIANLRAQGAKIPPELDVFQRARFFDPGISTLLHFVDRIVSTMGFTILEGLISVRCSQFDSETNRLSEEIDVTWYDDGDKLVDGRTNLHKKIQIWRNYGASDQTSSVLEEINNLDNYAADVLTGTFQGFKEYVLEELESTAHLSKVINDHRGDNIHAKRATRSIGTVVLNLCSLALWDMISPDTFSQHRGAVFNQINQWDQSVGSHGYSPELYLPIHRIAAVD